MHTYSHTTCYCKRNDVLKNLPLSTHYLIFTPQQVAKILDFWVTCGVKMMPLHDGWGLYPPQTASHIHIWHILNVWGMGMLSQGHMSAPLYHYTGQGCPQFWDFGSIEEWDDAIGCHYIMVEADIHLRLVPISMWDIYNVLESLVCCLKGIWVHPYIIIPAKVVPDFGFFVTCGLKMMPLRHGWVWHPPQTASHIHIRHIKCVWCIVLLSQGLMGAPLYCYTS